MAEIGIPEKRRVLIPNEIPVEPEWRIAPTPSKQPEKIPDKVE